MFNFPPISTRNSIENHPLKMSVDFNYSEVPVFAVPLNESIESFAARLFLKTSAEMTSSSTSSEPSENLDQKRRLLADDQESVPPEVMDRSSSAEFSPHHEPIVTKNAQGKRSRKDSGDLSAAETKTQKVAKEKMSAAEEAKLRRQEKNRLSAQRSRQNKKELVATLQQQIETVTAESEQLQARIKQYETREAQMTQIIRKLQQDNVYLRSMLAPQFQGFEQFGK